MESAPVGELPSGEGWLYEPKYDGFRCLAFRDGATVDLRSRKTKPLSRYFPEVAAALAELPIKHFVLDGELIIPGQPFDVLQLRLHPAATRTALLSRQHPATFIAFDLLADEHGNSLLKVPFAGRRKALEAFFKRIGRRGQVKLSKATKSRSAALTWLGDIGDGLDGIVAKHLDLQYQPGVRAMQKYKLWRTVDCVVGGMYLKPGSDHVIEYLLLGLYDDDGKLNYVGRASIGSDRLANERLIPIIGGPGFTGNAPAGESRWSGRKRQVIPVGPRYVVEVAADHIEAGRFRHGSRLLRWRDDKRPEACTMDQVTRAVGKPE
jgi:ATP-dependent DNA ligase